VAASVPVEQAGETRNASTSSQNVALGGAMGLGRAPDQYSSDDVKQSPAYVCRSGPQLSPPITVASPATSGWHRSLRARPRRWSCGLRRQARMDRCCGTWANAVFSRGGG